VALQFNLKLGTKLALGSLVGVALVMALAGTSLVSVFRIGGTVAQLLTSSRSVERMSESKRILVEMRALYRDALTAPDTATVDKVVATFASTTGRLGDILLTSESAATDPAERERMTKARGLLTGYVAGWNEAVANHRNALLARVRLVDVGDRMYRASDDLRRAIAKTSYSDVGLLSLERASSNFYLSGAKVWRVLLTGDIAQGETSVKSADAAIAELQPLTNVRENDVAAAAKAAIGAMQEVADLAKLATTSVKTRDTVVGKTVPFRDDSNAVMDASLAATADSNAKQYTLVDAAINSATLSDSLFAGLAILVMLGTALFGALTIGRPIGRIAKVLERLAGGDRTVAVPYVARHDEVGDTARAAQIFKDNLARLDELAAEQKAADARAEAEKAEALRALADTFEATVGGIVDQVSSAAGRLQAAAETMSAGADQTMRRSTAVAAASDQASSNVQRVAVAAEELAASVGEIGRRVNESATIAGGAARDADGTATKVARLSGAAQKIGDVVNLIQAIAEQTNLLALNATIEAARAGEAGRGFAVVASEVKSLADQTAKATAEIARQIEELQSSTADSASAIGGITDTIRRMNEIASTIASAVEEQGAATQEIARNVQQASAGTTEVTSTIADVSRAAGDASTASSEVLSAASDLSRQAATLTEELDSFLRRVRAA
jgi:methyl-accepting chemotaxis protein